MEKIGQFAASAVLILGAALEHLQRANTQTSIQQARGDIARAVLDIGRVVELAHALLPEAPKPPLH
jgi:hypothetical protein